jgi:ketosteroid isomerase-like protein
MKILAGTVLMLFAGVGLALAETKAPEPSAKAPSVSEQIKQLEHDWSDASKAADTDKLGQIIADNWVGIQADGTKLTKKELLAGVQSGKSKLESMEFGPMDVKTVGSVAVIQGSDTEKSTSNGKDSSGKYAWMDVFEKHDGKWSVVRSQNALLK